MIEPVLHRDPDGTALRNAQERPRKNVIIGPHRGVRLADPEQRNATWSRDQLVIRGA